MAHLWSLSVFTSVVSEPSDFKTKTFAEVEKWSHKAAVLQLVSLKAILTEIMGVLV